MKFLEFFNCYSTLILVIITMYYAWQTKLTVIQMERSRKLEFLPILSIESNHPTKQSNNKYVLQIIAYNIGKGIAQNPKIIVPLQKAQNIRTLGLQETDGKCFEISDIDMKAIPLLPNNKRCIEIKYNDIFNKEIVTRALITEIDPVFRVDNWRIILPKN